MIVLNLFYISLIISFLIDLSGGINDLKCFILRKLYKMKNPNPDFISLKPFTCSLCMQWWSGLFYIIISNEITLVNIALVAIFALLVGPIGNALQLMLDLINTIISKVYKLLR